MERVKNEIGTCELCGKEFKHYSWDKQRFCSKKCANNHKKVKVICDVCGKETLKPKSVVDRNEKNYCSRECYNKRSSDVKKIKRSTEFYQSLLTNGKCIDCGEDKYYLLQIHHIDSNPSNNVIDNLEIVCANCHIKRHLKFDKNNRYVYEPKELTDRSLLTKL